MGQITLDLDSETESAMKHAAQTAGVSPSRWVDRLIREKTVEEWQRCVAELAGAWPDFPEVEEIREAQGTDSPREPL